MFCLRAIALPTDSVTNYVSSLSTNNNSWTGANTFNAANVGTLQVSNVPLQIATWTATITTNCVGGIVSIIVTPYQGTLLPNYNINLTTSAGTQTVFSNYFNIGFPSYRGTNTLRPIITIGNTTNVVGANSGFLKFIAFTATSNSVSFWTHSSAPAISSIYDFNLTIQ